MLLLVFTVIPGLLGVVIFGVYALVDWAALRQAYAAFEQGRNSADLATLFRLNAQQNIHRINLLAEGVWVLLSAILSAIGLHGLLARSRR